MPDISQILQKARQARSFSIEELSDRTKIRKVFIESLEKGNFEDFQIVYLKAYIRSLAKELKILEDEDFLEAYKELIKIKSAEEEVQPVPLVEETDTKQTKVKKVEIKRKVIKIDDEEHKVAVSTSYTETSSYNPKNNTSKLFKARPKLNSNMIIYTSVILFLVIVLLITFWPLSNTYEPEAPKLDSTGKSQTIEIGEDNSDKSLLDFFKQSDSLYLKAEVSDTIWFSMIIDKHIKVQTTLVPQQEYTWTAGEEFQVTHGNAGKIKLYLNDKLLAPFSPPGYVAKNVIITADKIINNNSQRIDSTRSQKKKKEKVSEPEFRFIEPSNLEEFNKDIKKKNQ
jgi:transcriptional regulator with XRE-family HTH domain